ncbi:uncharacterized protein LOC116343934 isoform X2 [Contarinia nasturtii]|uniref:uncharacterized protein LOC116343934 isoform X2 n=1 Tax=Contarinia nasturtii TaxID=265458 RepID=UPI0012D3AF58|nr:uncharacterized protein LOC116343934 isoform X2 [Contarinia nasturtii]
MSSDVEIPLSLANGESENELITLGELTDYESTKWRFPETLHCPVRSCSMWFDTRAAAIKHYRESHAKHSVLCKICNYPLYLLTAPHHLQGHYVRKHPTVEPPAKVKTLRHECSVCHLSYKTYAYLSTHMDKVHKNRTKKKNTFKGFEDLPKASTIQDILSERSESGSEWEDIESEKTSSSLDESKAIDNDISDQDITVNSSDQKVASKKSDKLSSLRKLMARKDRSFNHRHRARSCTICGRSLKNYVLACNHYRLMHGRTCSMCPFCKNYYLNSSALIQHMIKYHPFESDSTQKTGKLSKRTRTKKASVQKENQQVWQETGDTTQTVPDNAGLDHDELTTATMPNEQTDEESPENDDVVVNDIITLGELTEYPKMSWKFPEIKSCPRTNCKQKFETRGEAINHYRENHSQYDVLCQVCNILVSLSGSHNLMNHYKRKHPDAEMPAKSNEKKITCQMCQKVLSFPQYRIHMNTKHRNENALPNQTKKSDRLSKRKASLNLQELNKDESKEPKSVRTSIRSKSISHLAYHRALAPTESVAEDNQHQEQPENDQNDTLTVEPQNSPNDRSKNDKPQDEQNNDEIPTKTMSPIPESNGEQPAKQNTRSTGVRNKACTICGIVLQSYVVACDHYRRIHGRNVLMCPYCESFFLQSNVLTKHVLAVHSSNNGLAEVVKRENRDDSQTTNIEYNTITESCESETVNTTSMPPKYPIEFKQTIQTYDEPLNLIIPKIQRQTFYSEDIVIDLSTGALDLSIKK